MHTIAPLSPMFNRRGIYNYPTILFFNTPPTYCFVLMSNFIPILLLEYFLPPPIPRTYKLTIWFLYPESAYFPILTPHHGNGSGAPLAQPSLCLSAYVTILAVASTLGSDRASPGFRLSPKSKKNWHLPKYYNCALFWDSKIQKLFAQLKSKKYESGIRSMVAYASIHTRVFR